MTTLNVLFLCTGNSARSILGEMAASMVDKKNLIGYSAGSSPTGKVNEYAIRIAQELNYPINKLRSKSWDEFSREDAPIMDIVITVCDNAAHEICPIWSGTPIIMHWGFPDPANISDSNPNKANEFKKIYKELKNRMDIISLLPSDTLSKTKIEKTLSL